MTPRRAVTTLLVNPHSTRHGTVGSPEYMTPPELLVTVREFCGGFDLDPASSVRFNEHVGARSYYGACGLDQEWSGRVWLNPPGGRARPGPRAWWERLCTEYLAGRVSEAFFLSFSLTSLQWSQRSAFCVLDFPTFVFAKRLRFWHLVDDELVEDQSPVAPCALTWLPPSEVVQDEGLLGVRATTLYQEMLRAGYGSHLVI